MGWQQGDLQENLEKDALFYEGTQKLQKNVNTAFLSQGLVSTIVWILVFEKKSVFSILPTPYTTCNNRGQNTLGDKWQQHIMVTDHSMCTGQATSCSNMSRRHVAATNRFVCTGELFWKSLTPKQNFVAAISRKKSNRLNLCDLLQRKMHFTGLKTTENWLISSHLFFRQSRT